MEQRTQQPDVSPYRVFSRAEWATLRADTPMTLEPAEIARLRSMHDRLDMSVIAEIYLPLSRLLSLYVAATQRLFRDCAATRLAAIQISSFIRFWLIRREGH